MDPYLKIIRRGLNAHPAWSPAVTILVVLLDSRAFQIVYQKEAGFIGRLNEYVPAVGIPGLTKFHWYIQ
jgi:hypothetical protein